MADTFEQLTADTICAPFLIMAECSALLPTMKPVTLCRKMMGVLLVVVSLATVVEGLQVAYDWLQRRMN